MKIAQKKLLALVTLLLLVGALSSCKDEEPPPEPVTLTFVVQSYEAEYFTPLAEEFMLANPEITVEINEVVGNNFQAYAEADVVGVNFFVFSQFQAQGAFLDLTPLIEQDPSFDFADFYPGTVELFTREDRIWAIPAGIDTFVMYYNKSLFNQSGLNIPPNDWTWDDMFSAAVTIRERGSDQQFGYAVPAQSVELNAMILMTQHGGQIFNDLANPTGVTFNHPLNVEAMQWYQDLFFDYNIAPTPDQANTYYGYGNESIIRGILMGEVGMWPGNFSERGGATWPVEWTNLDWGMVALPGDVNAATSGFGTGFAISAQAEKPEAAWKWVVYLSEQIPQALIPARQSLTDSKAFQDHFGEEAASVALYSLQNVALISPDLLQFQDALGNYSQAIQEIHNGSATAQAALDQAQEQSQ
jgi:multiple sugar transport system substrate-binding protein